MKKWYFAVLAVVISGLIVAGCAKKKEEVAVMEPETTFNQTAIPEQAQTITITPTEETISTPVVALTEEEQKIAKNKKIQEALKIAGFYQGEIDGKIGPQTKKAIRDFQAAKGLAVDGKVGPKTWAELEKVLAEQLTSGPQN